MKVPAGSAFIIGAGAETGRSTGLGSIVLIIIFVAAVVGLVSYLSFSVLKAQRQFRSYLLSDEFATFAAAAVGTWLGWNALRAGFKFLENVDWEGIGEELRAALEAAGRDMADQPSGLARLKKARLLLASGEEIERDEAALLASATLELGLRSVVDRHSLSIRPEESSLVGLAIALGQRGFITHGEEDMIHHYAARVRNRVMHGELGTIEEREVAALIEACDRFFREHGLT